MLNYNHLRYFWHVARIGHLTRAAEELNISQSALSTQIHKLEGQVGQALFVREGRGLALTEAGRIALEYANGIFPAGREMIERLRGASVTARAVLRVGALSTLSRNFQLGFLRPVFTDPDVEVVVRSGSLTELLPALNEHQLDVVLVNQVPLRDRETPWTARLLDEQDVSLIGSPERLAGRTDYAQLLAEEPLVLPTAETGFRNAFDVLTERLGITPRVVAEVADMAMLRLMARENIGLAVLPGVVVRDELASGRLVEVARLPGITESFFAIVSKRRFPNPVLDQLISPDG